MDEIVVVRRGLEVMKKYEVTEELLKQNPKLQEAKRKTELGILTSVETYYWWFPENRLKSLKEYVELNGTADDLTQTKDGWVIYSYFRLYKESIEEALIHLGYDLNVVRKKKSKSYYHDFNNVREPIQNFINTYNRFPTQKELKTEVGISERYVNAHGGMFELKRKMGCFDDDYVDDHFFVNRSLPEFMVAQFLIHAGVKYQREVRIHPDNYFRSDFYFPSTDQHLEIWGYEKRPTSERHRSYSERKEKKIEIYNELNLSFLSLDYPQFTVSYDQILALLHTFFYNFIQTDISFGKEIFVRNNTLADEEVYRRLAPYIQNNTLPEINVLEEAGLGYLVRIIRKKHRTYHHFGKKYNLVNPNKIIEMADVDEDYIFSGFQKLLPTPLGVTRKHIVLKMGVNAEKFIREHGGIYTWKLRFFSMLMNQGVKLPNRDVRFIYNIYAYSFSPKKHKKVTYTSDEMECASQLIGRMRMHPDYKSFLFRLDEKTPYKWEEYKQNFLTYAFGKAITPKGFDEVSPIPNRSYTGYLKHQNLDWWQIVDQFGRLDELTAYIAKEYIQFVDQHQTVSLRTFSKVHPYIDVRLMEYKPFEFWYSLIDPSLKSKFYTEEDLLRNFMELKSELGRLPTLDEFRKLSRIKIGPYLRHLQLKNHDFKAVLAHYGTPEELIALENYQKERRREQVAKEDRTKVPQEVLDDNFRRAFALYYEKYGKYPSRRTFKETSEIDESTYRNRLKCSWLDVIKHYGF